LKYQLLYQTPILGRKVKRKLLINVEILLVKPKFAFFFTRLAMNMNWFFTLVGIEEEPPPKDTKNSRHLNPFDLFASILTFFSRVSDMLFTRVSAIIPREGICFYPRERIFMREHYSVSPRERIYVWVGIDLRRVQP